LIKVKASQATREVGNGYTYTSIQKAIDDAGYGEMILVHDGTYKENINFQGKGITVRSENGASATIIEGWKTLDSVVIFDHGEGADSLLTGFAIQKGTGNVEYGGGGISCAGNSSPTITDCIIYRNSAEYGGGISCCYSSPSIINCTISDNSANEYSYRGCGSRGYGGGISCSRNSSPTITNCTISRNKANQGGGGIYCINSSSARITNCTISSNITSGNGGGICGTVFSPLYISGCVVSENSASLSGGGIYCDERSSPEITNCIMAQNSASHYGGGIACCYGSWPAIMNCTMTKNSASRHGGGIFCGDSAFSRIVNCIFWNDTPDEIYGSAPLVTCSDIQSGYKGAGNILTDPRFSNPDAGDYHLKAGSPCINKGTSHEAPFTDKEDRQRPGGTGYDMGAYESQTGRVHRVSSGGSIQDAIHAATNGDVIIVERGIYRENLSFANKDIFVRSTDPDDPAVVAATVIDANGAGSAIIFEGSSSVLNGFTVQNGSAPYGGGIYCSSSSPGITNCTITGNSASVDGGGMYCCASSSPGLTNCTITGNTASNEGGGMACNHSSPVIVNCTLTGNSASHHGGGISCGDSASPRIVNGILWNDTPDEIYGGSPVVTYSDIQNGADGEGNISADPHFINPSAGDYHLGAASPCIDRGTGYDAPFRDKEGHVRPLEEGYDIGAYEVVAEHNFAYLELVDDPPTCLCCHNQYYIYNYKSHAVHLEINPTGPAIGCKTCHVSPHKKEPSLEETTVCDNCHSPNGAFDGVNDPVIGAKANWENGVYQEPGHQRLTPGLENWCAGCHDDAAPACREVSAPNVMGDNATYGYNITGHKLACSLCHDVTARHIDGESRTYSHDSNPWNNNDPSNYQNGYRLSAGMIIPLGVGPKAGMPSDRFALCFSCHDYDARMSNFPPYLTNFQAKGVNRHLSHLSSGRMAWDSDWDYVPGGEDTLDSRLSCTACHNVHGSCNPVMIRDGNLISTPGTLDKSPALDFRWYKEDGYTLAIFGEESRYGDIPVMGGPGSGSLQDSKVCVGCHGGPLPIKYERTYQTLDMHKGLLIKPQLPPSLRLRKPKPGSHDVAVDHTVSFVILSNGIDALDGNTFSISLNGSQSYSETYTYVEPQVEVLPTVRSQCYEVIVHPAVHFGDQERITVTLSIQDTAGHQLTSPIWYFETRDSSLTAWKTPESVYNEDLFYSPELLIDNNPDTGNPYTPFATHSVVYDLGQSYQVSEVRLLIPIPQGRAWTISVGDDPDAFGPPVKENWLAEPDSITVDNTEAVFTGFWPASTSIRGYYGTDYQVQETIQVQEDVPWEAIATCTWTPEIPAAGRYQVYARWTSSDDRAQDAAYTINHDEGSETVTVNQQVDGGTWHLLGTYAFNEGISGTIVLSNASSSEGFYVVADAVRLIPEDFLPAWVTTSFAPKQGRYLKLFTGKGPLDQDTLRGVAFVEPSP